MVGKTVKMAFSKTEYGIERAKENCWKSFLFIYLFIFNIKGKSCKYGRTPKFVTAGEESKEITGNEINGSDPGI